MIDSTNEIEKLKKRIETLETQMALLMRKNGIDYPKPVNIELPPDVLQLVRQNKKIEAIKLFMDRTGANLKDAKNTIESAENLLK
jgi:ribosomal protein L7/L12